MRAGTLVAYFGGQDEARKASRQLRRNGFRRGAWASKRADGKVHLRDSLRWRWAPGVVMSFVLTGVLAGVVLPGPGWWGAGSWGAASIPFLIGGGIGTLAYMHFMRRARGTLPRKLIDDHARWLVSGESVLILSVPLARLQRPRAILQECGETPPAVFILYPHRRTDLEEGRSPTRMMARPQLLEFARRLSTSHHVAPGAPHNPILLRRIERDHCSLRETCLDLAAAHGQEQSVSPVVEWLLDNEHIIDGTVRNILLNLPRRYYRQLPALIDEAGQRLPRVYALARELVAHADLHIDRDIILAFIAAYQRETPLTIGELWTVPQMLRAALIDGIRQIAGRTTTELRERGIAHLWANRLIAVNRRDPQRIFSTLAELTTTQSDPSPHFASQLIDYLYDEDAACGPVQSWLERTLQRSSGAISLQAKARQSRDQTSIGNAFSSLRRLDLIDWNLCFEQLSSVEALLRQDPAGVYAHTDFATRDRCRRAIEDLHRGSSLSEEQVARRVLDHASGSHRDSPGDEHAGHVGTYLIGERRRELARVIGCRESVRFRLMHWMYRHHAGLYFGSLAILLLAGVSLPALLCMQAGAPGVGLLLAFLLLIPASQFAVEVVHFMVLWLLPPRTLAKMDYKTSGIPDAYRTLVVVPVILTEPGAVREEVERLEIRYLANKEDNILFALLTDFMDAPEMHLPSDTPLLQTAKSSIEGLIERHGRGRFFLIHRERTWCESEQRYIGWERKRGKLEELNGLIDGTRPSGAPGLVHAGDPEQLSDVRFVITLDSDTQLPVGTARRLIETLAHPLNRVRLDAAGRILDGYSIIQPRVSSTLPSMSRSPFSRLFSNPVGIDPYTNAVSDVHQDLRGEGSYHGKGIYDVRPFHHHLGGRFPEERILSHDLIEGAHVRVGLASDIELYDEFPRDYLSYVRRQHRWIRGDWQIADWILPRVPGPEGRRIPNHLSSFDRGKIADNLRRSLLPIANMALLLSSWSISVSVGWVATAVVGLQLLVHSMARPFVWSAPSARAARFSIRQHGHDLVRLLADAALLPFQAWLALDAIVRVAYRLSISRRGLLEWTPARALHGDADARVPRFVLSMGAVSVFSLIAAWLVSMAHGPSFAAAAPWLLLWFISPGVGWLLTRRPGIRRPEAALHDGDRLLLRNIALLTWRYFVAFVNEHSFWLPPDNYQVSYQNQLAMRTSPTNIGLWMVSVLGANHFGYTTVDKTIALLTSTMATIGQLSRHEGHLLNWYDIRTLTPLKPHYVSTVDSGNLLGALWTLDHGLGALMCMDLLDRRAFSGLHDAGEALRRTVVAEGSSVVDLRDLQRLLHAWDTPPERMVDAISALRRARRMVEEGTAVAGAAGAAGESARVLLRQIQEQLDLWLAVVDRYLGWMEILGEKTEEDVVRLDPGALGAITDALHRAPSLKDVAGGNLPWIDALRRMRTNAGMNDAHAGAWIDRVLAALDASKWLAGEMLASGERLLGAVRDLSGSMDMRFLYDSDRRLFSIGYNVAEGRLDHAYYDLLASEARLGSFIAIARGDIPADHWFAMSRPYGVTARRQVLLSWTGTMFEYLMPLLFQRSYPHALLDEAMRGAVAAQVDFGRAHGVPWGISESASADLDVNKTYQYRAFGVPSLGLKQGLTDQIVVAPYATLLAVSTAPRESLENLARLIGLGMLGDFGFYESIDFSKQPAHDSNHGVVVQAYMAHHQGMGFLALTNLLHDSVIQAYFHGDPRVRAMEPLLQERTPRILPTNQVSTRTRIVSVAAVGDVAPSVSQFETPNTVMPRTHLLSNGRLALMITNAGGGYTRWNEFDVTRWMSDRTRDPWGTFCYIHDVDSDWLWSTIYQPVGGDVEEFSADFSADRAAFRRLDHGVLCETEIIVAPEDDVEIRRVTLTNRSLRTRHLDLTSYVELAMAAHRADRQHPAFNKLFIQTEAVPEANALLAFRRPRHEAEPLICVGHRFTCESGVGGELRFETDRARFIGRGRTLVRPMGAFQEPGKSQGVAIDPMLSLRHGVTVGSGDRVQVSMVIACAATREHVLTMMHKYADPHAITAAMDAAWGAAQLEMRLMRIQPDDARRFQQLASHLLFPDLLLRSPADRIAENRKGQAGLWSFGISGDLPLTLVVIDEKQDISLVRQILQAHAWWRVHGLKTDLVILNEEAPGYERTLHEQLERLIHSFAGGAGMDRPGGVFLRSAEFIGAEDLTLLRAVASVVMVAARGTLPQQLAVPPEAPELPAPVILKREYRDPPAALPFMELPYFNSIGGFTPDGHEYAIYLGPGMNTPMPWVNVIANPSFGTLVSETGAGFTWQGNSQSNRLTPWSNDPVIDPPSEAIYIRDEDTGVYWTPCARPIREDTAYRARHGAGYTVFEHNSHGIEQELTVFVPVNDAGGEPIKLQKLKLRNDTARTRKLSVTYYVEWVLGDFRESSQMYVVTSWDDDVEAILARNAYQPDYADHVAFAAISLPASSHSGDRNAFLGRNGSLEKPAALGRTGLSNRTGAGLDPCAGMQSMVRLTPGEEVEIVCMLGQTPTVSRARGLVLAFRDTATVDAALEETRSWWDLRLDVIAIHTPEPAADLLVNRWLLYQTLACRIWGRSGFYQSGGGYGFRDQLQDVMALLYAYPAQAREHILRAAGRQFVEGDVQHWWHAQNGAGIRSRISDDLLWLPFVVARYVRITGDVSILHEPVAFLVAPSLEPAQTELFQTPGTSAQHSSLFDHCQRAVLRGQTSGAHGLPLIGSGDWNDGMNLVGIGGKGESIWLGWFLADVLKGMAELSERLGLTDQSQRYQRDRNALMEQVDACAWDGAWYLRATTDDGMTLGSSANAEAQIDSLPQSWASLCDAPDKGRVMTALGSAWEHLVREDEGLVLLFEPPFDRTIPSPGYIQGYPPGVRENGGQYTHAALWLAMAMARNGDGTRTATLMRMLNPIEHTRDPESVWRYGIEPYVIAADVYRLPGRMGQGGWSWYTGSAGLMYRIWVEEILGLQFGGETLRIAPVIPRWWDGFRMTVRHGDAIYEINVENPGHCETGVSRLEMDGQLMHGGVIPLVRDLVKHRVVVHMGGSLPAGA